MPQTLSDLAELKAFLSIDNDNTAEDKILSFYLEYATDWIAEILNRPNLFFKQRTEYYNGTGTQKLLLRSRPVYTSPATPIVYQDKQGFWGSASGAFTAADSLLTYGVDYALWIDQADGVTSRSGILLRLNNYWENQGVRQEGYLSPFIQPSFGSIKVTYYGGWIYDQMPSQLRLAGNLLVAGMRNLFPVGAFIGSESYEERNVTYILNNRDALITPAIRSMILSHRNHKFG